MSLGRAATEPVPPDSRMPARTALLAAPLILSVSLGCLVWDHELSDAQDGKEDDGNDYEKRTGSRSEEAFGID